MNRMKLIATVAVLGATMIMPRARFALAADASTQAGVTAANDGFYAALNVMFTGDVAPMLKAWSHSAEVTDMGPFGAREIGWEAVRTEFEREAKMKMGGKIEPTQVLVRTDGDLGYVVCIEHGENLSPAGKPVAGDLRATSVYRLEKGEWKMVHHHTDQAPNLQAAARGSAPRR